MATIDVDAYYAERIQADPPASPLRIFIDDVRNNPRVAAACALIGFLAGLAVTWGLAELLIVMGAV